MICNNPSRSWFWERVVVTRCQRSISAAKLHYKLYHIADSETVALSVGHAEAAALVLLSISTAPARKVVTLFALTTHNFSAILGPSNTEISGMDNVWEEM